MWAGKVEVIGRLGSVQPESCSGTNNPGMHSKSPGNQLASHAGLQMLGQRSQFALKFHQVTQ